MIVFFEGESMSRPEASCRPDGHASGRLFLPYDVRYSTADFHIK